MSDVHKEIRDAWEQSEYAAQKLERRYEDGIWQHSITNPSWTEKMDYRMVNKAGAVVMQSNGKPASTDYTLDPNEYLDGCVKAAISLLMKPDRSIAEVRKARAWLTLGLEVADS